MGTEQTPALNIQLERIQRNLSELRNLQSDTENKCSQIISLNEKIAERKSSPPSEPKEKTLHDALLHIAEITEELIERGQATVKHLNHAF